MSWYGSAREADWQRPARLRPPAASADRPVAPALGLKTRRAGRRRLLRVIGRRPRAAGAAGLGAAGVALCQLGVVPSKRWCVAYLRAARAATAVPRALPLAAAAALQRGAQYVAWCAGAVRAAAQAAKQQRRRRCDCRWSVRGQQWRRRQRVQRFSRRTQQPLPLRLRHPVRRVRLCTALARGSANGSSERLARMPR